MNKAETITYAIRKECSRDSLVEWCKTWGITIDEFIKFLELGRKAFDLKTEWIPVSERLPDHQENNDYYLVTIQCEHYDGWDDYVTGFAEWTKHGWDELSCYIGQIKVIAWMPLPEPYKERREDG